MAPLATMHGECGQTLLTSTAFTSIKIGSESASRISSLISAVIVVLSSMLMSRSPDALEPARDTALDYDRPRPGLVLAPNSRHLGKLQAAFDLAC